nr:reverse transcriptase domain-containing protein [Tanacetum cinerariifolium]
MDHFSKECKSPRSQDRWKRESYKKDPKVEEPAPKAIISIDEEVLTEYALMAKSSSSSDNKVYDVFFCSTSCRVLKRDIELKGNKIEYLRNELEEVNKEKESIDFKIENFENKYCVVPPPPAQVYSPPKKDLSWMGLPEFVDDTVTDYTRPTPSIGVSKSVSKEQEERWKSNNPSFFKQGGSSNNVRSKPMIKFVKESGCPNATKVNNTENARKPTLKYSEMYRNTSQSPRVRGNKRNWNNQKSQQLGKDFMMQNKACIIAIKIPTVGSKVPIAKPIVAADKDNIDDKGYWDSGCSRYMTGNISYLSEYDPFNGGYVSFSHEREKITGKGSIKTDESMLWHRRLGHLNFKTMNKMVRSNLVKGLPSKSFENDHSCIVCLKGKQHKASCKSKLVNSVSKPLHTLHMDLFGPTSVSSLNHKWYCLVVTDDFSRFSWTFFLKSKDETSRILRNFITEIENLKDLNVKIIRSDSRGEFRNKEIDEFCSRKGIKREFSNARTPQQNGVAERRNRTLIEAARTMVLVIKPLNKTPYITPRAIISDRGTHFCNDQFARVMKKFGVTYRLATPYHPQTSGQVEVSNRGLKRILKRAVGEICASCSDKLDDVLWAFCTSYKTPIRCTPYKLVYGKACHLPIELEHKAYWALKHANFDLKTAGDHRKVQINELNKLHNQAYENSLIYKEKTKRLHDSKIKNRVFNIGDRVLLFNSRLKIFSGKLKSHWSGPFTISQVYPYGTVEISQPDGPNFKVNGHRLKHYFGEYVPKLVVPDLQTFLRDN